MVVVMVVMWMILATCSGLDDVLVMVDDPVTEVRNLLACLGHLLGLETLGLAGVVRSRQILIGGALGVFHRPVVLVEGQTEPRYEHCRLLGGFLLTGILVWLPETNR